MKKINIMIVFYSAIQPDRDTKELTVKPPAAYDCRLDDRFRAQYVNGRFTQEAPVYAVAKMLKEQGKSIDYLYGFATTDERRANVRIAMRANEEPVPFADQRAFFREAMRETCADLARTEFRFLDFDYPTETLDEECNRRAVEAAMRIKQDMKADGHDWADCSLYIDLTGGPRAADMVLSHVMQLLMHDGMQLEKMIYADYGKRNCLYGIDSLVHLSRLIAGADAFVRYGSSLMLERYFGYVHHADESGNEHLSVPLRKLLFVMHQYSDVMQICQVSEIQNVLLGLKHAIEACSAYVHSGNAPVKERAFGLVLDTVRREYEAILKYAEGDDATLYYQMIDWCEKKGFTQQAMTLCVEWMPAYLMDKGFCEVQNKAFCETQVTAIKPDWRKNFLRECTVSQYHADFQQQRLAKASELAQRIAQGDEQALDAKDPAVPQEAKAMFRFLLEQGSYLEEIQAESQESQRIAMLKNKKQLNEWIRRVQQFAFPNGNLSDMLRNKLDRKDLFEGIARIKKEKRPHFYQMKKAKMGDSKASTREAREREFAAVLQDVQIAHTAYPKEKVVKIAGAYWAIACIRNGVNHAAQGKGEGKIARADVDRMICDLLEQVRALGLGEEKP